MKNKLLMITAGIGFFTAGVFSGKQIQKSSHKKKTVYAGTLQVYYVNDSPELYLALTVPPEDLVNAADVVLNVSNEKVK